MFMMERFRIRDRVERSRQLVRGTIPELITSLNQEMTRFNNNNNAWWKVTSEELADFYLTSMVASLHTHASREQNVLTGLTELSMRDLRWKLTIGILQESLREAEWWPFSNYERLPDPFLEKRLIARTPPEELENITDETDILSKAKAHHIKQIETLVRQVINEKNYRLLFQDQQFLEDTLSLFEYSQHEVQWRKIGFLLKQYLFPHSSAKNSEFAKLQLPPMNSYNRDLIMMDQLVNALHASGRYDILWMANDVQDILAVLFFQGLSKKASIGFSMQYASLEVKKLLRQFSNITQMLLPDNTFQPNDYANAVLSQFQQFEINDKKSLVFGLCRFPKLLKKVIQNDEELKLHMYEGYFQNRATFGLSPQVFLQRVTNSPM